MQVGFISLHTYHYLYIPQSLPDMLDSVTIQKCSSYRGFWSHDLGHYFHHNFHTFHTICLKIGFQK